MRYLLAVLLAAALTLGGCSKQAEAGGCFNQSFGFVPVQNQFVPAFGFNPYFNSFGSVQSFHSFSGFNSFNRFNNFNGARFNPRSTRIDLGRDRFRLFRRNEIIIRNR